MLYMESFLEDLPVPTQLLVVAVGLVVLFFAVRTNARHNKKKRLKDRDFGTKLRENRKKREAAEQKKNKENTKN